MKKPYILVSACLLGNNTKYNGSNNYCEKIELLRAKYTIIPFCPEVAGGLTIPRKPSEIRGNMVVTKDGDDYTLNFTKGAVKATKLVDRYHINVAVLKDGSPSCGSKRVYDGKFSDTKIPGEGISAGYLNRIGVKIYAEYEIDLLLNNK